jgi:hypothetical protein
LSRALREKVLKQGEGEVEDDGTYKGMTGYVDYRKVHCYSEHTATFDMDGLN